MSYLDLDDLGPEEMIARYLLDRKGNGLFLRRSEYKMISKWIEIGCSPEQIVMIIEQITTERGLNQPPAISSMYKHVANRLSLAKKV